MSRKLSRKPRLVHEGSPIADDGRDNPFYSHEEFSNHTSYSDCRHQDSREHHLSSSTDTNKFPASTKFKLQTRLVVGEEASQSTNNGNQPIYSDLSMNRHVEDRSQHYKNEEASLDAMMTDDDEHDDVFDRQPMQQRHHQSYFSNPQTSAYESVQQLVNDEFLNPHPPSCIYHMPSPATSPLVVIDGANIAYTYAESLNPSLTNHSNQYFGREPNPRGIKLAVQYFLRHQCRVQAVVPTSWYKLKPSSGDHSFSGRHFKGNLNHRDDAKMLTEEVEELRTLRQHGFLVPCPPGDDDDAYVLSLARREEERLWQQERTTQQSQVDGMIVDDDTSACRFPLGGYVVSNDFFHDAVRRDERQQTQLCHFNEEHFQQSKLPSLSSWQSSHEHSLKAWLKKHRISYSFANVGLEVNGVIELEFLPNPRNELIEAIDSQFRLSRKNG
ncbi:hypothetical protein ACHAW6_010737 [Cyclotella cf. meneghiniana]